MRIQRALGRVTCQVKAPIVAWLALAGTIWIDACANWATAQDDAMFLVEEESAPSGPVEAPRRIVDGREVFIRPFAEAFVDPDQRLNLEPKYYFALSTEELPAANENRPLARAAQGETRPVWQVFSVSPNQALAWLTAQHPLGSASPNLDSSDARQPFNLRWLDYRSGREPERYQKVAFLAGAGALHVDEGVPPQLCVARVRWVLSRVVVDRILAQRDLLAGELNPTSECLETLDRPALRQPGANLQGRVIAVWKQTGGRHAVDFSSETLHPDADRRLWLTPGDASWGTPAAIQFHDVWIQKPSGPQRETVLAVKFSDPRQNPPTSRWVAYDFPLARPLVLENLRKLTANTGQANTKRAAPTVDVAQLLGEDLVDEYSRRLVDAVER